MTRACGECSLCCRLLPVIEHRIDRGSFQKAGGERCIHQRRTGCAVYRTADMPQCCRLWNCRWLVNDDTADLRRPDRSHYVIDVMPDFITTVDKTGAEQTVPVIQIWVDPKHPDAHRDPALRAYLERRGEEGFVALIRLSPTEAFVLAPPAITGEGFVEMRSNLTATKTHTAREIMEALSDNGI